MKKGKVELSTTLKKNQNISSSISKNEKKSIPPEKTKLLEPNGINKIELHEEKANKESELFSNSIKKGSNSNHESSGSRDSAQREEIKKTSKNRPIVI